MYDLETLFSLLTGRKFGDVQKNKQLRDFVLENAADGFSIEGDQPKCVYIVCVRGVRARVCSQVVALWCLCLHVCMRACMCLEPRLRALLFGDVQKDRQLREFDNAAEGFSIEGGQPKCVFVCVCVCIRVCTCV